MGKLLLIIAGFVVAWWILRGYRRSVTHSVPQAPAAEDMVRCAQCGVHLPRSESRSSGDNFYCCEEHRRMGG